VLAGKRRRALDSTVHDDAVARQDTVTLMVRQTADCANVVRITVRLDATRRSRQEPDAPAAERERMVGDVLPGLLDQRTEVYVP
jgi:hypothetical protein